MFPKKIKNFNAFLDGTSFVGRVIEGNLPTLASKNSEYRGGGIEGSVDVDMGLEKMELGATMSEWDPSIWNNFGHVRQIVMRAADMGEDNFEARDHVFTVRGRWNKIEPDALKPSEDANIKLMCNVIYFKVELQGRELVEIDVENMVRRINGFDQMASMRAALAR